MKDTVSVLDAVSIEKLWALVRLFSSGPDKSHSLDDLPPFSSRAVPSLEMARENLHFRCFSPRDGVESVQDIKKAIVVFVLRVMFLNQQEAVRVEQSK